MSAAFRLALEGFGSFEAQALQSYFRLAGAQQPSFVAGAELAACDFCVVDADRPAAVEAVRAAGRQAVSVYVGARAPEGGAKHLPRPIDPRRVARALEALVRAPKPAPTAAPTPAPAPAARPAAAAEAQPRSDVEARAAPATAVLDVLVVDDVDITRRLLAVQLQRLGCRVTEAADAAQALGMIRQQRFRVVFADAELAGIGGTGLCQYIKQAGAGAPAVVLVGAPASASERVRHTLAGCDGYLGKPIATEALSTLLRAHGNRRRRAR